LKKGISEKDNKYETYSDEEDDLFLQTLMPNIRKNPILKKQ
jgi:hypothetical protein